MSETLVNIFLFGTSRHLQSIGHRLYEREGSYSECRAFLQSRVAEDCETAPRSDLPSPLTWDEFHSLNRMNRSPSFFLNKAPSRRTPSTASRQ